MQILKMWLNQNIGDGARTPALWRASSYGVHCARAETRPARQRLVSSALARRHAGAQLHGTGVCFRALENLLSGVHV